MIRARDRGEDMSGPESDPQGELRVEFSRCSALLSAAYSSLRLQSRVLRSRSGSGIWRGQDWWASILALRRVILFSTMKFPSANHSAGRA
jgi:hypothetical protein